MKYLKFKFKTKYIKRKLKNYNKKYLKNCNMNYCRIFFVNLILNQMI